MDKVTALMFKVNRIKYKKNEAYESPEGKINRKQKFYCIFAPYDRKRKIQDTEFVLEVGGEDNNDPYYLDLHLDVKFKARANLTRDELRDYILSSRLYDYVIPYIRTRILEFTMLTNSNYPYDIAYDNLEVKVIEKREGLINKLKRIFNVLR